MLKKQILLLILLISINTVQAQYITEILEYKPAPGQFINDPAWGTPEAAESLIGSINGYLTLGAFGGYVIFKFANPVENHPDNPYGVDFSVFGNPLKSTIYNIVTWSEHGIVSVMKDENGNGLPDDTWYELAGSDYFFSTTEKNYSVTYSNPGQDTAVDVPWVDNHGNSGFIFANTYHKQTYYPLNESFPDIDPEEYTLSGTKLEDEVDRSDPNYIMSFKKAFGYADNQIRNTETADYSIPDNPYTLNMENSGGDAFDISWAVDENGNYVDLDQIHFVKVHNAILADAGWLGEISTEVTGAIDIAPNASVTGVQDMIVIKHLPDTIIGNTFQIEVAVFKNGRYAPDETISWTTDNPDASVNSANLLEFSSGGELKITASLDSNPNITASDSTLLIYDASNTIAINDFDKINLYPNPVTSEFSLSGADNAHVYIYNVSGQKIAEVKNYSKNEKISVDNLSKGIYFVKILRNKNNKILRFVKY